MNGQPEIPGVFDFISDLSVSDSARFVTDRTTTAPVIVRDRSHERARVVAALTAHMVALDPSIAPPSEVDK